MDSSKKRLTLTITSMCIAVVAVIVSVVAIFAAQTQGVQSTFKVSYKARNVAATVSAEYTVLNEEAKTLGDGSIDIDAAADQTVYKNLSTNDEIKLTAKNNEVVFKYTFKNNSSTKDFTVTLTDNTDNENVIVQYAYADSESTDPIAYAGELSGVKGEPGYNTITVAKDKTVHVYIRVTIEDAADDAWYESKENNYLSWELYAPEE